MGAINDQNDIQGYDLVTCGIDRMQYLMAVIFGLLAIVFYLQLQRVREENIYLKARDEEQTRAHEEKVALLAAAQEKLSQAFQALSSEALEKSNTSFLQLARQL